MKKFQPRHYILILTLFLGHFGAYYMGALHAAHASVPAVAERLVEAGGFVHQNSLYAVMKVE